MTGKNQRLTLLLHSVVTVQVTTCPWECFVVVGLEFLVSFEGGACTAHLCNSSRFCLEKT